MRYFYTDLNSAFSRIRKYFCSEYIERFPPPRRYRQQLSLRSDHDLRRHTHLAERHRDRNTWENQGGHVEKGESVDEAAARELSEEAGVKPKTLEAVCDHRVRVNGTTNWGRKYLATVATIQPLPNSEIAEVKWFDQLPSNQELTYPWITPLLYHHLVKDIYALQASVE